MMKRFALKILLVLIVPLLFGSCGYKYRARVGKKGIHAYMSSKLQTRIEKEIDLRDLRAATVAVVLRDGAVLSAIATDGMQAYEIKKETLFGFASVSKTLVAAVILKLIQNGRLSFNTRVGMILPYLMKKGFDKSITIGQLLDHSSGLGDYLTRDDFKLALVLKRNKYWSVMEVLEHTEQLHDPGEKVKYSNANYLILGLVAEAYYKKPVATVIRNEILKPFHLDNLYLKYKEPVRGTLVHSWFGDYDRTLEPDTSLYSAAGAAGSLVGRIDDLAAWGWFYFGGHVLNEKYTRILSNHFYGYYGYGACDMSNAEFRLIGHDGFLNSFHSVLMYSPEYSVSIAVSINESRKEAYGIATNILSELQPLLKKLKLRYGHMTIVKHPLR